jgi:SAM-dependent methyltransferase
MLAKAREKQAKLPGGSKVRFQHSDICTVDLHRRFDAALMMFAVLGYQQEDADVLSALGCARQHLREGGIFIFDVWVGPAVLNQRQSERVKDVSTQTGQIFRVASGELDISRHLCMVRYRLRRLEDGRSIAEAEESHSMRYFFAQELEQFLESSSFVLDRLGAFPEFHREPGETTWNVLGVARAV